MQHSDEQFSELPDAIRERLARQDQSVAMIVPQVDAAIAGQAGEHFAGRRPVRTPRIHRRWAIGAAAAAAVLLAVLVVRQPGELPAPSSILADDVDRSGRVDVLDAFALSRMRAADPGAVAQEDIERIMAQIVSLQAPGAAL